MRKENFYADEIALSLRKRAQRDMQKYSFNLKDQSLKKAIRIAVLLENQCLYCITMNTFGGIEYVNEYIMKPEEYANLRYYIRMFLNDYKVAVFYNHSENKIYSINEYALWKEEGTFIIEEMIDYWNFETILEMFKYIGEDDHIELLKETGELKTKEMLKEPFNEIHMFYDYNSNRTTKEFFDNLESRVGIERDDIWRYLDDKGVKCNYSIGIRIGDFPCGAAECRYLGW